jgi:hypothetical protein
VYDQAALESLWDLQPSTPDSLIFVATTHPISAAIQRLADHRGALKS